MAIDNERHLDRSAVGKSTKKWILPEITVEGFTNMVRKSPGGVSESQKDGLDALFIWWTKYEEKRRFMLRFENVSKSTTLHPLERRKVQEEFKETREVFESLHGTVESFVENERIDFSLLGELEGNVEKLDRWFEKHDKITVTMSEAIISAKGLNAKKIRQRVAQGTFEELIRTVQAENLYYAADISWKAEIKDSPEIESRAISSSMEFNPWNVKERRKMGRIYKKWQKEIKEFYPDEISDKLKLIWKCAIGKVPPKTSVFDILDAQWDTFEELYEEGAMEFELDEE